MEEYKKWGPYISSEAINLLLESIAEEELSLAHILYQEGEKIEAVVHKYKHHHGHNVSLRDLLKTNESARKTIVAAIKKEMLLEFKLENVIKLYKLSKHHHRHCK